MSLESERRPVTGIDSAETSFFEKLQTLLDLNSGKGFDTSKNVKICGVDAHYSKVGHEVTAVAVLFSSERLLLTHTYRGRYTFPYVSGLFFLHEGPFAVAAVAGLKVKPDIVCFDAHGLAHPRHLGLATICGAVLGIPSIGVAKSILVGKITSSAEGDLAPIMFGDQQVGFFTRFGGVRKYWSPGYSVSMLDLEIIIRAHAKVCLRSIAEANQAARKAANML